MDQTDFPGLRGWSPGPNGGTPQGTYPGVGDPFPGAASVYSPVQVLPPAPAQPAAAAPAKGGGLSSMLNLNEIKGLVERMGGLDGILTNVGKLQKIMATMQQMAPIIRLLTGKGKTAASDESEGAIRPRKRRRRSGSARSRSGRASSRRKSAGRRRR